MNSISTVKSRSVIETALALLLLFILLFDLYAVLSVFLGVFTYAIIFSVSFAQLFEKLVRLLNNKRKLAAFIYGLILVSIIVIPFIYIISALGNYLSNARQWLNDVQTNGIPPLADWIISIPVAGGKINAVWQQLQANPQEAIASYGPQIRGILNRLISGGAGLFGSVLELILGIIISAILLVNGESALKPIYTVMKRIVGDKEGPPLVHATGRAVKGVAVGVMGTAFIAAFAAWVGFAIAGISFAVGLAALTFLLVVIQVGPVLVFIPAAIWLFMTGQTGMGIFVSIYTLAVMIPIDNILKPILIAKSGKLPVLVLFLGVIGGMVTWGFTGMFKGAIILAVFYTIMNTWLNEQQEDLEVAI